MGRDIIKIILDTNILIMQIKERIDIVDLINSEFEGKKEIIVRDDSVYELKKLDKKGVKEAKLALEKVLKQKVKILNVKAHTNDVDEKILIEGKKQNAFILTNDRVLKEKAKRMGLRTISFIKSKRKVMVI